jgi:signal transduction histidine kinase
MARRLRPPASPPRSDVHAAVALAVVGVVTLLLEPIDPALDVRRAADATGVALMLGMTLPLAWRRRAPLLVLGVPGVCALAAFVLGYAATVGVLAVWAALGSAALHTDRATAIGLALLGGLSVMGAVLLTFGVASPLTVLGSFVTGTLPALVGDALRTQRALGRELRERSLRLEQLRSAEVERARAQERVHVARDVHDAVGHHLSAISLMAGGGRGLAEDADPRLADVLATIQRLSGEALADTRRMLDALRAGDVREGAPDLGDLDRLLASCAHAGVPVEASLPTGLRLPAEVGGCAYRIVQEALTNVARHARPAAARVRVAMVAGVVEVLVDDDGDAPPAGSAPRLGHGLLGMRERAALLGGLVEAGPRPGGGWRVRAALPLAPP